MSGWALDLSPANWKLPVCCMVEAEESDCFDALETGKVLVYEAAESAQYRPTCSFGIHHRYTVFSDYFEIKHLHIWLKLLGHY
jgi:hypothetical protein